ncbi:MAG: AI-2E family transporter [Sulfitobacter sp.]
MLLPITLILIGWALHAMGSILVPLVFGAFVALLVYPVDHAVSQILPRQLGWVGHIAAMLIVVLVGASFLGALVLAAQQTAEQAPFSQDDLSRFFAMFTPDTAAQEGEEAGQLEPLASMFTTMTETAAGWASGLAGSMVGATGTLLTSAVLIFFVTLLALLEAPKWRDQVSNVFDRDAARNSCEVMGKIAGRLRRYLLIRTALGLATSALYGVWLWWFDIDLLIVWMLLAFLLNFIPTFGSLVSGILPVAYAFTQLETGPAFVVGTGIFMIEQVMGNFVDPRVQGQQLSISPMVILIALLFWGWIWGIAGAVLAVPLMITILIFLLHVPMLDPLALFISNARSLEELKRIMDS